MARGLGAFRARRADGQFLAHHASRSTTIMGTPSTQSLIATETVVVHDENLGIDRRVIAGQPVPPDLVAAYQAKTGGAATSQPGDPSAGADTGEVLTGDALKARAAELDIDGRSQMTADELRAAIAEAEAA
jgi:hypothetical protein